ncbi:MAG: DNA methyltransferase [Chloroflexi bacterium]|nr:DNA methyltransferase [Chloroflexota bacterium]
MAYPTQLTFLTNADDRTQDWTFNGASTRELTHCYHDYPARMIPQVAGKLLDMFAAVDATLLFDPYCGTGTSLVEGMMRGLDVIGTDLNPLARLIAQAKTLTPDLQTIDKEISRFHRFANRADSHPLPATPEIMGISRLEFWFKPLVIEKLARLVRFIDQIGDADAKIFFQVAFSETVRESSNTRNEEFKLYRYDAEHLKKFNPDAFEIMSAKLKRNRIGLQKFLTRMRNFSHPPTCTVYGFNTVDQIPSQMILPASVDIVVTSPPYGDSHTTVAYGQYSRLSAAWLGLDEPDKIDAKLMGSKIYKRAPDLQCAALEQAIQTIHSVDPKRASEVAAFYADLKSSITHVSELIKPGGYACYVVGNRKVKGRVLPTNAAVRSFFEICEFEYIDTFIRSIPNKRMPLRNSPTNATGQVEPTMTNEYIVVMRRPMPRTLRERRASAKSYMIPPKAPKRNSKKT